MPVRVFGNASGGGGTKGYPTADVKDIVGASAGGLKILLKWTDPDDTILDNATLAQWQSTLIVRKLNSVPESFKDGVLILESTVKNQYQNTWYEDTNSLIDGATYYYRFFTKSTEGIIGDGSPTVKVTASNYDPVLANNSWEIIAEAAESGAAAEIWNIGDEIEIYINTWNETHTMQIWDFSHYDKADGSGKAGIVFGSKYLTMTTGTMSNSGGYGWRYSQGRNIMQSMVPLLSEELSSVIKEVTTYSNRSNGLGDIYFDESSDKIFIPNTIEVGISRDTGATGYGIQFPIFTDNNSRDKKLYSESGNSTAWWLRDLDDSASTYCLVGEGGYQSATAAYQTNHFCFCFCV